MRELGMGNGEWRIASVAMLALVLLVPSAAHAILPWTSPMRHRVLLAVDARGVTRTSSPVSVDIDLQQKLTSLGVVGKFDESTIEVIGYTSASAPKVFDATRAGYEKYLLPWRTQKYYPINKVTLSFVMPDQTCTQYAVYFDTEQSGLGRPERYPGMVGDGDWFREGYQRREIGANVYDSFADMDGDGDLDILKGGTEPYIYIHENVGGNRYVDRGRLTNGGALWEFPKENGNNRSWLSVEARDWDGDGDTDLFVHFVIASNGYSGKLIRYENTTVGGGTLTFTDRGPLTTVSGSNINFTVTFVDWDGDGKKDMLSGEQGLITFYKNTGSSNSVSNMQFANGQYINAGGLPIQLWDPRVDCADIDSDGDLDLFSTVSEGRIYLFKNVGTRTSPVLAEGRMVAFYEAGYSDLRPGIKLADFDGDGLLDFAVGRYWERSHWGWDPRVYGRLFKNVGTATTPRFQACGAFEGCPYTLDFQRCNAIRQNGVRTVDWDNDGRPDLIASDTDGFVWVYRNTTNRLFPVFATGERVMAGGDYVKVLGEEERRVRDGYARTDVCDWNNDGKKDLLVADGRGWIFVYPNQGTDANPVLAAGTRLTSYNSARTAQLPIDGTARSSVMVCDWDRDGKKDVIHAITGQDNYSVQYNWPIRSGTGSFDSGFLFFKNVGTDAAPVLDYPKWVTDRYGNVITYSSRPNCGSYVDWDGDGRPDFITGEFESSARFYRNTIASGEPRFDNTSGVSIVQPYTVQMMSGADAKDFNGNGKLDILTGQGHGGTGLRFYEREYINDTLNSTSPTTTTGSSERGWLIHEAKGLSDNTVVLVPQGTVSATFNGFFYVQTSGRTSGIRVQQSNHGRSVGERVDVRGVMYTNTQGERYMTVTSVVLNP